jgi:SAM-dependent methyltransferase
LEILLESSPYFGHLREAIKKEPSRFQSALDLGCGPGLRDLRLLKEMGLPVLVGIDVGRKPDPLVRRDYIGYVCADVDRHHVPTSDEGFDLVIMDNVIEHIYDPRRLLGECRRVLKKGGILAVLTPNQARLINRFRLLLGRSVYYPLDYWLGTCQEHISKKGQAVFAGHIREYTIAELRRMLSLVGFEIESVHLYPAAGPSRREEMSKSKAVLAMYNAAEKVLPGSGYMISVLARKV